MRVGFVSAWYERGAAYVTRAYVELAKSNHEVFVYARGGGDKASNTSEWNQEYVTYGYELPGTEINYNHFNKWLEGNKIDVILFNEQREFDVLYRIKIGHPNIVLGAYIDYYTAGTVDKFEIYDFLICNTKRHYQVFSWHPQCYYIPWGTNIDLYNPGKRTVSDKVRFFHSMGTTTRKGTESLINSFISHKLGTSAELIIHTQIPISAVTKYSQDELKDYNIRIIEKTVPAPGLYYLGDVYVYPTKLDGLGLTVFEALSSGMPVITTAYAPMNEVITTDVGKLVDVESVTCREDGYYWPLTDVNEESLADAMQFYIQHFQDLNLIQKRCREYAVEQLNWLDRKEVVCNCFTESKIIYHDNDRFERMLVQEKKKKKSLIKKAVLDMLPDAVRAKVYHSLNAKKVFKRS